MNVFPRENQTWKQAEGYARGVLMPYGSPPRADVQIQVTKIKGGDQIRFHRHLKQTEYVYVLEGSFSVLSPESEVDLGPGDLVVINPGELHGARNSGRQTSQFLTLKLNGSPDDTDWSAG